MASAAAAPVYSYLFTDLLTNQVRGALPLSDVSAQVVLSQAGQFQASAVLSDPRFNSDVVVRDVVVPRRTAYWVIRNFQYVTGGIVWDTNYDAESYTYQMTGATFDSYPSVVRIDSLLAYTNLDVVSIAINLWNSLQAKASANIGMVVPTLGSVLSGTITNVAYDPSMQQMYGDAISQLSQSEPGFDYYVDVFANSDGTPGKRLVLGDPYVGVAPSQTGLVFRRPGNLQKYTWAESGTASPNDIASVGGGTGAGSLVSSYRNQAQLDAGYPLIAGNAQYKDVFTQDRLDSLTTAYGDAVSRGVDTMTIVLEPGADLTSVTPGQSARIVIQPDEFFAAGFDEVLRISAISYSPPTSDQPEAVTLTLTTTVAG